MKHATASLARDKFVMSEITPSGQRTRYMPGQVESGTTLGRSCRLLIDEPAFLSVVFGKSRLFNRK
jgi:hypothetical protein